MTATCKECGATGQPGGEIAPYNFGRGKNGKEITRWLCVPSTGRQCRDIRYGRYREHRRTSSEDARPT